MLAEEQKRAEADRIADLERRKRREERERQEQAARVAERDARQQQLQRRKVSKLHIDASFITVNFSLLAV